MLAHIARRDPGARTERAVVAALQVHRIDVHCKTVASAGIILSMVRLLCSRVSFEFFKEHKEAKGST